MNSNRRGFFKVLGGVGLAATGYVGSIFPDLLEPIMHSTNNRGVRRLSPDELAGVLREAKQGAEFEAIRELMPRAGI